MENDLIAKNSVLLNADASRVWDALTNPEMTKKYFYNCEAISDWETGKPIEFITRKPDKDILQVKGVILAIDPCRFLQYTVWGPVSGLADIPDNYSRVTIELFPEGRQTELVVTQDMFNGNKKGYESSNQGWELVLNGLKKLLESN